MRLKLIGLGQCGSVIVYDVLAHIFEAKPSKELKSTLGSRWKEHLGDLSSKVSDPLNILRSRLERYFKGALVSDFPVCYVVDGNRNNKLIDGLKESDLHKREEELRVHVNALTLSDRNDGCTLGQIGEHYFRKELREPRNVVEAVNVNDGETHANVVVFSAGGGSGSGGVAVFNSVFRATEPLLINMMVLPPAGTNSKRQKWNTGRCISRLASEKKHTALLLFSNLSEDDDDQFAVNQYVTELIIRLANFTYPGNLPTIGADVDRSDLRVFFTGKPAFVGMSSLEGHEDSVGEVEAWVDRALSPRISGSALAEGLSIEAPGDESVFEGVDKIMVVVGIPPDFSSELRISQIIKRKVLDKFGEGGAEIDYEIFSYGSLNTLELTVFLRMYSSVSFLTI